ncbi:hypothetical protein B0H19DRAFT_1096286 [Mycena capillaripes]|nr:hypothetical protein B0H19DRAFT_1096286 [Mycena capillaripes]
MESAFKHRFSTNYVPSDEEIEDIQMDLVLGAQELARLDERIRELSVQRDHIQAYVDSHRALISHPRRLPADILQEIFVACLPADRNAVMSVQEAPLLLCRICSAWRAIALSTPRLWASLHVPFTFVASRESLRMPAVAQWLERSAACPISLSLTYFGRWALGTSSTIPLLQSLAVFLGRWRHVEVMNLDPDTSRAFAEISYPMLESVKFSGMNSSFDGCNLFKAKSLRSVSYSRGTQRLDEIVFSMPLHQLQHLTLESNYISGRLSFQNIFILLGRCIQLISLHVGYNDEDDEAEAELAPISMPFLQTFILSQGFLPPGFLHHLIECVAMPQLRHFNIPTITSQWLPSFSLAPLGVKSPLIEDLTIPIDFSTAESLRDTLQSFPSLKKLVVVPGLEPSDPAHALDLLTPNPETILCPALQEFVVTSCSALEKSTLERFIQGRLEVAQGFRRLEILFYCSRTPELMSVDIQLYRSRGLDISLVWPHDSMYSAWNGLSQDDVGLLSP